MWIFDGPTVRWANPADITYGTPLGTTQLDATASVPGSFVCGPALGTVLHAGSNQTLTMTFTPTDTTDYNNVTTTVQINITPPPLTITANSQSKVYGAPLSALTAGYSGFVNGDTAANLTTSPTLSTTATASSHVAGNPYSISASGAVDPDYSISYKCISFNALRLRFRLVASDFPGIVCILDGDRCGAVEQSSVDSS